MGSPQSKKQPKTESGSTKLRRRGGKPILINCSSTVSMHLLMMQMAPYPKKTSSRSVLACSSTQVEFDQGSIQELF